MKRFLIFLLCMVLIFLSVSNSLPFLSFEPAYTDTSSIESTGTSSTPMPRVEWDNTWCYDSISSEQKRMYRKMYEAATNMTSGWIDLGKSTSTYLSDIAVAYRAFIYDYPEYFWVPYSYAVTVRSSAIDGRKVFFAFEVADGNTQKSYLVTKQKKAVMQAELDSAVNEIIRQIIKTAATDFEMELALHDILAQKIKYSTDYENDMVYTIYGALVNNEAVCEGYSRAMSYICRKLGIPCILVTGSYNNEGHMWNMVSIEDNWYHVDVTWDAAGENLLHTYFNLSDEQITYDHIVDADILELSLEQKESGAVGYNFRLPKCDTWEYNYYNQKNLIIDINDLNDIAHKIAVANKTQAFIELGFKDSAQFEKFVKNSSGYLAVIERNAASAMGWYNFEFKRCYTIGEILYLQWQ